MLIINIIGGLGNQMFQYAMGIALAIRSKQKLKLDITAFEHYKLRDYELDVFNIDPEIASKDEINQVKQNELNFTEKYFHFDPKVLNLNQSVYLDGYWKSEKYFINYGKLIRKTFTLKNKLSHQSSHFHKMTTSTTSISLHIRRGDYITNSKTNSFHGTCSLEYYKNAVSLILNKIDKPHFFIFSDDLDWAKENLDFIENITFVELDQNVPDYEEMYLMSQCKHNIIANSSFSWWGAWLNQNQDKAVIAPEQWSMDETMDTKDLIPQSWLRLGCESSHTSKLVSIIIPCYNQAQYLEESVKSAVNQTYLNIEIIIVNDGSADNTQEIAERLQKKHPNLIKIITQVNSGLSQARNSGIKESLGEYILPLDADDRLDLKMINKCMELMIHNNVDIVYVDLQCFGAAHYIAKKKPFPLNDILYENLPPQSSLYKKNVWTSTKGYKQNMKEGYEDWEFWINAYKHNFTFHYLPEILYYYRVKKISRETLAMKKDIYLKAKIALNNPELYTMNWVQKSIATIKETEQLADLYFYHDKNIPNDEKKWLTEISHTIKNNKLEEKQILKILDKKVGIYALDTVKSYKNLKKLCKETEADFTLFYSTLRYEVPSLQNLDFAWDKNKGIVETSETVFPFVFKSKREDNQLQLIAYQKELKYLRYKSAIDAETAKKKLASQQHRYNMDAETTQNKLDSLQHKYNVDMDTITNRYNLMMESISNLIKIPGKIKPLQKISAYKSLTKTYFELRKAERETRKNS